MASVGILAAATGIGVLCEGLRYDCVCIVNVVRYEGLLAILSVELVYAGQKSPLPVLSEELEIQFLLLYIQIKFLKMTRIQGKT